MNRENLISSYIQNVYEEIQEEAKPDPVPTAGLGSKTITNVPEQEEQPVQQEKASSILSRFMDGFKQYMRGDDDELQTTKTVRKERAAREANLEGVSILDLSLANPDGAVDGLINIPTKITKPERAIDVQRLQDNVMQTLQITKPEVDTANIDITPSTTGADGGAAPSDGKGLGSKPQIDSSKNFEDKLVNRIIELEGFIGKAKQAFSNEKYLTIGYGTYGPQIKEGQTITKKEAEVLLREKELPKRIKIAQDMFDNFDSFSDDLKIELIQGIYRGDFKKDHETVKLINKSMWEEASKEFLNHKEYLKAKAEGKKSDRRGIVDRLESISKAIYNEMNA